MEHHQSTLNRLKTDKEEVEKEIVDISCSQLSRGVKESLIKIYLNMITEYCDMINMAERVNEMKRKIEMNERSS